MRPLLARVDPLTEGERVLVRRLAKLDLDRRTLPDPVRRSRADHRFRAELAVAHMTHDAERAVDIFLVASRYARLLAARRHP